MQPSKHVHMECIDNSDFLWNCVATHYSNSLQLLNKTSNELFKQSEWSNLAAGRWLYADHITLGESRAVNICVHTLALFPGARDVKLINLQDNQPVACSAEKGRSPAFALNRSIRQRVSSMSCAGFRLTMPWIESKKQPADTLSRTIHA